MTEAVVWLSFAMNVVLAAWNVRQARRIRRLRDLTHRLLYGAQNANVTLKAHLKEGFVLVRLCHLEAFTSGSMPNFDRAAQLLQGARLITFEKEDES